MKVFGGMRAGFSGYAGPAGPPMMDAEHLETAIRYALSQPGVATVDIGVHTPEQLRRNVEMVSRFRPLSKQEGTELAKLGKRLAGQWGEHFGDVSEPKATETSLWDGTGRGHDIVRRELPGARVRTASTLR